MEENLDGICSKGVPEEFRVLLQSQLSNARSGLEKRQRRWNPKVISICLSLYCRSPQAYQDLSKCGMLILPSKRLLQYYENSVPQAPGLIERNFQWMANEATKNNIHSYGKHEGLLID